MMKAFFFKLLVFFLVLMIPLYGLEKYYDYYFSKNLDSCNKPLWVLKQQQQHYDFAAIGSSRVFNMLDIVSIEKITGKKGINIAASGSGYAENYLLLKQFTKSNTISTLLVQVDVYSLDADNAFGYPFHDYLYLNKLNDAEVDSIYRDNVPALRYYSWKFLPFTKYMEYSNFYSFYKVIRGGYECSSSFLDTTKGTFLVDGSEAASAEKSDKNQQFKYRYIDAKDMAYLEKIISYCRSKNIRILFYSAPEYSKSFALQGNRDKLFKEIKHLAAKNSITYYNFETPSVNLCNDYTLFKDNTHLNIKGSLMFSKQFADSLKQQL